MGEIIHINRSFKSIDNKELWNRYMCIIDVDDTFIYMLPMSTFSKKMESKSYLLSIGPNFQYSVTEGNTQDGYIKCNQIYKLQVRQIGEVQRCWKMKEDIFRKLLAKRREQKNVPEKLMAFI